MLPCDTKKDDRNHERNGKVIPRSDEEAYLVFLLIIGTMKRVDKVYIFGAYDKAKGK